MVLQDATAVPDSAPAGITTFSLASYDGAFGNQLDSVSRKFYDERVSYYVTGRASGSMTVEYTAETSARLHLRHRWWNRKNGTLVIDRDCPRSTWIFRIRSDFPCSPSVDAFLYDHPEIFWFRGGSYFLCPGEKNTMRVPESGPVIWQSLCIRPAWRFPGAEKPDGSPMTRPLPQVAARIAQEADDKRRRKMRRCGAGERNPRFTSARLCTTIRRAYESYQQTGDYRIFCSAGAILPGNGGKRRGPARGTRKDLRCSVDQLGIPCVLIGGTVVQNNVREGHMWNGVQIGGRWYLVDATLGR